MSLNRSYMMRYKLLVTTFLIINIGCSEKTSIIPLIKSPNDLHFDKLADVWDEAIPLGNGMVGALIWQKGGKLRFSLDRADLWDLRPMENLEKPEWKFNWVYNKWKQNDYEPVQQNFDVPYDNSPAPSKIPRAAIEFDISALGEIEYVHLYVKTAIFEVKWENGTKLLTFIHATEPVGWYRFEGLNNDLSYALVPPPYNLIGENVIDNPVTGQDLRRLGYPKGTIDKSENSITYKQEGWGGFNYQVYVAGNSLGSSFEGCWSISSEFPGWDKKQSAEELASKSVLTGIDEAYSSHLNWWQNFWSKSSINVPDTTLQKQWTLEQYKFGSTARVGAPPISLQAIWTADNGKLPPWKGDFHHDLNTQLSYWPSYSGNHLEEGIGYLEWLWKYKDTFKKYTKEYFETDGLNVPGVSTLTGEPMGGWIQYAFGPTVSAWLGHHFYLHWRYSMDREFLETRAYPWIKDVAVYLDEISETGENSFRKLPISSSPEIHNNSKEAWYSETTNFDLALIRWTFEKAAELASELNKESEANKWKTILKEWPQLAVDNETGMLIAPQSQYSESHRHFSHQLAYHPLGIIDFSKSKDHEEIIINTIKNMEEKGTDAWTGYSFSWMGGLKARAFDGEGAEDYLKKFSTAFCLPNSFHVNGDQSGTGLSTFTYRPFTLEGNFAFASALQEMLIQSHSGIIIVFPAVPAIWKDISFDKLRTEGAFLISAKKKNGRVTIVEVIAEQGGILKIQNPFGVAEFESSYPYEIGDQNSIIFNTNPGDVVKLNLIL